MMINEMHEGGLDPDLIEYHEERDRIFRKIDERENDLLTLRIDLDNHGGGIAMLRKIAIVEARIAALHGDLEELHCSWSAVHAFDDVFM